MGVTAGLTLGKPFAHGQVADEVSTVDRLGQLLPLRKLGRTGESVTMLGLGGSHLIIAGQSPQESQALIETALEEGIRFFDTAQQYGHGRSERLMGRFLTPKYRDVVYIMTKTEATDADGARRDMDECRKRLNVDTIDLMQMHHISSVGDVDRRVNNGVVDVLLEAREQGKIRHLGFTGHDTPNAHLHMFKRLDEMGVQFDASQFPVNVVDPGYESFIENVMPKMTERRYGVLAMKTLAFGHLIGKRTGWRRKDRIVAHDVVPGWMSLGEALGFVWSLPVATLISGMDQPELVRENAKLAREFVILDEAQRLALIDKAAAFAGPNVEFYKTEV